MRELLLAIFLVAVSSVVVASLAVMGIIGPCYWHEPNQAIYWLEVFFFTGLLGYGVYYLSYYTRRH